MTARRTAPAPQLGLLALALALGSAAGCKAQVPVISEPFSDDFERAELGPLWHDTGGGYGIAGGKLSAARAYNHPLWLKRRLPRDVVIELDAMSRSPSGDLKIEMFGDGESFDPDKGTYDPTGYVLFFGGHNNSESIIGRLGEHEGAVKAHRLCGPAQGGIEGGPRVEPGRVYHWTITRKGGKIDWQIDGQPYLSWEDPQPLHGQGHEYFGVNDWETDVSFDNLRIRPTN